MRTAEGVGGSSPTPQVKVTLNAGEVHEISLGLLQALQDNAITMDIGVAALGMSLGRIMALPVVLTPAAEVAFVEQVLEWAGMYFAGGEAN